MIGWIFLAVYIIGIPCWVWFEKKFFPFHEEDYHIEYDGAHEITPEVWKCDVCARASIWPLVIAFFVAMLPIILLDKLFDVL